VNTPNSILQSYADAFRDLVNARVRGKNASPSTALRLNAERDWSFVCVAMDVVGDASLAIESFLKFSLDGPTRYEDVGERYLRLYGLLCAAYVQQQAVLKLYSLMNCPNPKDIQATFNKLEIRTLRHQIASHSLDFLEPGVGRKRAFVPVRICLSGFSCTVTENRGDTSRTVKLDDALEAHCRVVTEILDKTYEKSVRTLFKGQTAKIAEFSKKLADLRFLRDGNLIFHIGEKGEQREIRVVFVEPRMPTRSTTMRTKKTRPRTLV